jgi:hypothetical protein
MGNIKRTDCSASILVLSVAQVGRQEMGMGAHSPQRILVSGIQETIDGFPSEVREDPTRLRFTLAVTITRHFLGQQWCEDNILQNADQSKPSGFLRVDFRHGFEGERKNARILDLAECLFNLQNVEGFDDRVDQLRTGDIESTIAEFDFARFIHIHDIAFKFVIPTNKRGKDFDFAIEYVDGREACADAKCRLEETEMRAETIRNSLERARQHNLPPDKPGIIFVKVPQTWMESDEVRASMGEVVNGFERNTRRVVSVVLYTIAVSALHDRAITLMRHRFLEYPNTSHRFDTLKRWTLFKDYEVSREWGGMHPKWVRVLSEGFLFGER